MSKWLEAARQFEERHQSIDYFEMHSALSAIEKIDSLISNSSPHLLFLLGEPGVGKSFLLNYLKQQWTETRDILLIETPFLTPIDLLKKMLEHKGIRCEGDDIERFRHQAMQQYAGNNHLIMIDEAQLLSTEMREFVRILSDTKSFWFILAMHRSEGENILRAPHFKSRPHQVLMLQPLNVHESKNYLSRELLRIGFSELNDELTLKLVRYAHTLSKGNFRNFKKIIHHLFQILHYTNTHDQSAYQRPSKCTMTMAAISAGLLDD